MKIPSVGTEFHADGQTDMMKLMVAICSSANGPKNLKVLLVRNLIT